MADLPYNIYNKDAPVDETSSEESSEESSPDSSFESDTTSSPDESEMSDDDSSDSEVDPWYTLVNETIDEHRKDMNERYRELIGDVSKKAAYKQTCTEFASELNATFRHRYIILLKRIRVLKKDPTYKKIAQTVKRMRLEDEMDEEEALEMAVKQRKVLLQRIFEEWDIPLDSDGNDDDDPDDDDDDSDKPNPYL